MAGWFSGQIRVGDQRPPHGNQIGRFFSGLFGQRRIMDGSHGNNRDPHRLFDPSAKGSSEPWGSTWE
jgi:hypothetical protein